MGAYLAMLALAWQACAQSRTGGNRVSPREAPLQLFISGPGRVMPFQDGQLLLIGAPHSMTAIPKRGHQFIGWTQVNVFTMTETVTDELGNPSSVTNTVVSPIPGYIRKTTLRFYVEQPEVIFDVPGVRTIVRSTGWQANFTGENQAKRQDGFRFLPCLQGGSVEPPIPTLLAKGGIYLIFPAWPIRQRPK